MLQDDIVALLTNPAIYVTVYLVVAIQFSFALLVFTGFPLNYLAMWLPWTPALYAAIKEENRRNRLRFVPDSIELSAEALSEIICELKKIRHL